MTPEEWKEQVKEKSAAVTKAYSEFFETITSGQVMFTGSEREAELKAFVVSSFLKHKENMIAVEEEAIEEAEKKVTEAFG